MSEQENNVSVNNDLPWSYRQRTWVQYLIDVLAGIAFGIIGTLGHRMGAAYSIPYGLVLSLLLVTLGAWSARSRSGTIGYALYLVAMTGAIYMIATHASNSGDALLVVGFNSTTLPFWSQKVGYFWFYGSVILPLILLLFPRKFFRMPTERTRRVTNAEDPQDSQKSQNLQPNAV